MGDEITTATASSNGTEAPPAGANEDLLSQIFGGAPTSAGPAPSAAATKQKAIDDILRWFGSSGGAAAQHAAAPAAATSWRPFSVNLRLLPPRQRQRPSRRSTPCPATGAGVHRIREERTEGLPRITGSRDTTGCSIRNCTVQSYWRSYRRQDQLPSCGAQGVSCVSTSERRWLTRGPISRLSNYKCNPSRVQMFNWEVRRRRL